MNKKLLYIPHIPWKWAKQRPQFIAEALAEYYDVTVMLRKEYKKEYKGKFSSSDKITFYSIFRFPFNRIKMICIINRYILREKIKQILHNYDIVWFSSPEQYYQIKDLLLKKHLIIYDCMDDILEFPSAKKDRSVSKNLLCIEKELVTDSNMIFCSSTNLGNVIQKRYGINDNRIAIVNNAVSEELLKNNFVCSETKNNDTEYKHIIYIGTIDKWFDFDLLEKICNKFDNIIFDLYGPIVHRPYEENKRIRFHGLVSHDKIVNIMKKSDMLIMPFILSPLIESVNPVKLYEYILSGKPTVAIRYQETNYFSDFVYLYSNYNEFENHVVSLIKGTLYPLKTMEDARRFCEQNTWKERAREICRFLDEGSKKKENCN